MASLILRIVSLFMGRLTLLKGESLTRHRTAQQRQILTQIGWPDAPEPVTGSDWNEWPDQIGIPGRMTPECAGERVVQVTVVYDDQVGRPTASEMNRVADELWRSAALEGAVPVLVFRSERDSVGLEAA